MVVGFVIFGGCVVLAPVREVPVFFIHLPAPKDLKKYCPVFSVHFLLIGEISMAKVFVQFLGSRPVATNYKYAIKVEDPEFGDYYHKSQVKSLDDKKEELFKSNACLMLPLEMLREYIGLKTTAKCVFLRIGMF